VHGAQLCREKVQHWSIFFWVSGFQNYDTRPVDISQPLTPARSQSDSLQGHTRTLRQKACNACLLPHSYTQLKCLMVYDFIIKTEILFSHLPVKISRPPSMLISPMAML
jgi:hypothetical protein